MSIEDYRPTEWREVVGQPTDRIRADLERGARRFLFYGPAGTGKTTTAYLIANEVQGGTDSGYLELNASKDRGIDTIRDRIIPIKDATTLTGAPMVIFLDEMEAMTSDAQHTLRQPMEQSHAVWILTCNDVDRVIDPIQSRCYDYEFAALSDAAIRERIQQVAGEDGVDLTENDLDVITSFAAGDMRNAIQRYTQLAGSADRESTPDERISQAALNLTD